MSMANAKTVPQSTGEWTADDFPKALAESVQVTKVCEERAAFVVGGCMKRLGSSPLLSLTLV